MQEPQDEQSRLQGQEPPEEGQQAEIPGGPMLNERAEEVFRGAWASLFFSGRIKGRTVLICSADRREGASTVACGLALAGTVPAGTTRVALVDFNLRHPSLHEYLNLPDTPGVADVLLDGLAPEAAALRVNDALDMYPVGNSDGRILDLLRCGKIGQFLKTLWESYEHVLVDVAAVNHYPDAQVLAGVVGQAVLVAHCELTPREAVAQAHKRLEAGGGTVAGLILNLRTYPIPRFLYRRV